MTDRLEEISERLGNRRDRDAQDIDYLISMVAMWRQRTRNPELSFEQIEAMFEDLGPVAQWLIEEVKRLRLIVQNLPLDEMKACAAYANQSRHPGIVVDAKTISTWIKAQLESEDDAEPEVDRCDPSSGYHSTPHRGCILR